MFDNERYEQMRRDPENYMWGIFYFNPHDDRVILPKRNRWMGWTVNFARPQSWIVLALIILISIVVSNL